MNVKTKNEDDDEKRELVFKEDGKSMPESSGCLEMDTVNPYASTEASISAIFEGRCTRRFGLLLETLSLLGLGTARMIKMMSS